jgi:hypothetical protein
MAGGPYAGGVDVTTVGLVASGLVGMGLVVMGPVLVLLSVKNGRDRRWVRRHAVSPCAALRSGDALPDRFSVFGRTVPGRAGMVVAPLSGAEAVWFRLMVCSFTGGEPTRVAVLWEESGGEPFGVADETGQVAVSGRILLGSLYSSHLSMWAQTRLAVGSPGPVPTQRVVDETTEGRRRRGPRLQQVIDRGLVGEDAVRRVDRVTVVEEIVPAGVPLHVIGKPAVLDGGMLGLTLPKAGRHLALSQDPAETERILAGDTSYGMGCALWATLIGAACLGVFAAIAFALSR